MHLKPFYLVLLGIVVLQTSAVHAQTVESFWTNAGGDQLWTNPANWDPQGVPLTGHAWVNSQGVLPPKITEDVVANRVTIALNKRQDRDMYGELTIEGASLTMVPGETYGGEIVVSGSHWAVGILTIRNSTVTVPGDMDVSKRGRAELNMLSGLLDIEGDFGLSSASSSNCTINLYGGVIDAFNVDWTDHSDSLQRMNVTGGRLVLEGNDIQTVQEGLDQGYLVAYNGFEGGEIQVDYNETDYLTVVRATHTLDPRPADGSVLPPAAEVELGWTLPDHRVPGQTARADVYFTDDLQQITNFTNPGSMQVVNRKSVSSLTVPTETGKTYYWAVDTHVGGDNDPILGPIFSFMIAQEELGVDAGDDIIAVLQEGSVTGPLSGTITGSGDIESTTVKWSVVSEPDPVSAPALIVEPTSKTTTITLTAAGIYVVKLEVSDGKQTESDTLTITAYDKHWITLE